MDEGADDDAKMAVVELQRGIRVKGGKPAETSLSLLLGYAHV